MKWSLSMRYQRLLAALVGALLGACAAALLFEIWALFAQDGILPPVVASLELLVYGSLCALGGLTGALFTRPIAHSLQKHIVQLSALMSRAPAGQLLSAIVGLIVGLVLALLGSQLLSNFKPASVFSAVSVVLYIVLGSLGATVGAKRYLEWPLDKLVSRGKPSVAQPVSAASPAPIVADTSALIDGRMLGICRAGFLSGTIVVSGDVLTELRHIADDADPQRRARGRRGLETLKLLREEPDVRIVTDETAFPDIPEVDARLVKLALRLGARLLTTDYNLQTVASVAGVRVLRINDLANALRSALLAGDEITLFVQREGRERAQGVGYFTDGTMVVVEDARPLVGQTVSAVVTSVLQTAAGRMVFARLKQDA